MPLFQGAQRQHRRRDQRGLGRTHPVHLQIHTRNPRNVQGRQHSAPPLSWGGGADHGSRRIQSNRFREGAVDNPDHVAIVIHNYRWRLGLAEGEPQYDDLEKRLALAPMITVPTITLESDAKALRTWIPRPMPGSSRGGTSTGPSPASWGTICPQEAPAAFLSWRRIKLEHRLRMADLWRSEKFRAPHGSHRRDEGVHRRPG